MIACGPAFVRSCLHPPVDLLRNLRANSGRIGTLFYAECSTIQARELMLLVQRGMQSTFGEEARQFALHGLAYGGTVCGFKAVQHQFFDVQFDVGWLHIHPPTSASVSDFSNLAYSLRAARNRCFICTGSPASAARKAAFSAMLRILPPVTLRRASFVISRPKVGVLVGKMRCQISARCAASGKGNWTMKRMRR